MSLQTWKKEFYLVNPSKRMTKKQAIGHSLRKWIGLRKSNLEKHEISKDGHQIGDNFDYLTIEMESCAMCVKYFDKNKFAKCCEKCPLAISLGEACDNSVNGPYETWCDTGNPNPMIKALRALLEEK